MDLPEQTPNGVGVLVLGMHRSGTSAITSILAELGCALGGELNPPAPDNPRGYWGHRDVVLIHEEFLTGSRRTWSDPRPFREEDFLSPTADTARERLAAVLQRDFLPKPVWILKDPRMCRLAGLWRPLFESSSCVPRFLLCLRSPRAVAASLQVRDGMAPQKALLLWLRHYLEAESFSRGFPRAWVELEQLAASPTSEVRTSCEQLGIADQLPLARLDDVVAGVFDRQLLHQHGEPVVDEGSRSLQLHPWITRAYESLQALAAGEEEPGRAKLDRVRAELSRADRLLIGDPAAWEAEVHGERYTRLQKVMERHEALATAEREEIAVHRKETAAHRDETTAHRDETAAQRKEIGVQREVVTASNRAVQDLSERHSALSAYLKDTLEQKHVQLLGRSLDLAAQLEDRSRVLSTELERVTDEMRRAVEERDQALHRLTDEMRRAVEERDLALQSATDEMQQVIGERDGALEQATAEHRRVTEGMQQTIRGQDAVLAGVQAELSRVNQYEDVAL